MSNGTPSSSGLGSTGVAFGLGMALLGVVVGYLIGAGRASGPSADELDERIEEAVAARMEDAPQGKAVNNAGGELRKLSDKEKQDLLGKDRRPPAEAPAPPADSPFLSSTIESTFSDPEVLDRYKQAVGFMSQGNARKARPILTQLHAASAGQKWNEQVGVLLADARISVGEVNDGRALLTEWRTTYPKSSHQAVADVAEGKALMKDGQRAGSGQDGVSPQQERLYGEAIAAFDKAIAQHAGDPALEEAMLNKAALLGDLGRLEEAEKAAFALVEAFPNAQQAPRALFNVGRAAFDAEDFERAERLYSKLVEKYPAERLARSARNSLGSLELLGKPAPELDVEEWVGDSVGPISSLKGKPVLLVFWATWCPHCRKAMPKIESELWQKYRDEGLQVIAVTKNSRGQTTDKVREYLSENNYTMPVAVDPGNTSRNYGVSGIPAAALIDKNGKVVFRNHPAQVTDELIKKYL